MLLLRRWNHCNLIAGAGGLPDWNVNSKNLKKKAIKLKYVGNRMIEELEAGNRSASKDYILSMARVIVNFMGEVNDEPRITELLQEYRKNHTETKKDLESIKEDIFMLKSDTTETMKVSYTSIVARNTKPVSGTPTIQRKPSTFDKNTEVVINMYDEEAKKSFAEMSPKAIMDKVNNYVSTKELGEPIRAARSLPSGDISIVAKDADEAKEIRGNQDFAPLFGNRAKPKTPTFGIIVYDVPTKDLIIDRKDTRTQDAAIENIKAANNHHYGGLQLE